MATPESAEPTPGVQPVSTATSQAKPISAAELAREIAPKPPELPATPAKPTLPQAVKPEEEKKSPPKPDFKEALRKQVMEKKEEPKDAPKPKEALKTEEPKKPVEAAKPESDEVPEDQRKVLPHDKPDTAKRIKFFLSENKRLAAEAQAAKAELEAAKKAPASPEKNEEVERLRAEYQKTQDELLRFRRLHDINSDPEFKTKYREPVSQAEATIESTLKSAGFGDATLKAIKDAGGFAKFSRSNQTFTVNEPDPENEGKTRPVLRTAAELARAWLSVLPVSDSESIKALVGKQQLLQSEEQAAIQRAQEEAKTYFESQNKAQREAAEKAQADAARAAKEFEEWAKKTESETEWLKDREIPEGATAEQKKEIQEANEFNAQLRASLKKHPTDATEYGQLKLEAAESHHLRREFGRQQARIAQLEEELKKARGAMRTTPKGGSLMAKPASEPKKPENANPTDFKSGLRARIMQAAGSIDE